MIRLPVKWNVQRIFCSLLMSIVYTQPSSWSNHFKTYSGHTTPLLKMLSGSAFHWVYILKLTILAPPGSSLVLQNLRSHPDLLNQKDIKKYRPESSGSLPPTILFLAFSAPITQAFFLLLMYFTYASPETLYHGCSLCRNALPETRMAN